MLNTLSPGNSTFLDVILLTKQTTTYKIHGERRQRGPNKQVGFQIFLLLRIDSKREIHTLRTSALSSYTEGSGCAPAFIPQGRNGLVCKHNKTLLSPPFPI